MSKRAIVFPAPKQSTNFPGHHIRCFELIFKWRPSQRLRLEGGGKKTPNDMVEVLVRGQL